MLLPAAASPDGAYAEGTVFAERVTGAGSALPAETTVTVGLEIWVVDWLPEEAPPGTNSPTSPDTLTASPTATVGTELVKTKTPSLVAASASACGSWNQKPLEP
jgi:hypothetical protein